MLFQRCKCHSGNKCVFPYLCCCLVHLYIKTGTKRLCEKLSIKWTQKNLRNIDRSCWRDWITADLKRKLCCDDIHKYSMKKDVSLPHLWNAHTFTVQAALCISHRQGDPHTESKPGACSSHWVCWTSAGQTEGVPEQTLWVKIMLDSGCLGGCNKSH